MRIRAGWHGVGRSELSDDLADLLRALPTGGEGLSTVSFSPAPDWQRIPTPTSGFSAWKVSVTSAMSARSGC